MARKKKDATEREVNKLLDSLLEGRSPEEIMGGGGLLDALTKRVMERVLEGELTDHLGYEKHAREGHNGGRVGLTPSPQPWTRATAATSAMMVR